ncbi:MAG: hypothetical protein KKC71_03270 [Chloroflexi bacterium]|nr:hypothetical protein [Chloroflexota bacterium]
MVASWAILIVLPAPLPALATVSVEMAERKGVFAVDQMGGGMNPKNTFRFAWRSYVVAIALIAAAAAVQGGHAGRLADPK